MMRLKINNYNYNDNDLKYFRFVEEHKEKVKTDTLQRLHTVVNLSELLATKQEGIDPTLRDDQVCVHAKCFTSELRI